MGINMSDWLDGKLHEVEEEHMRLPWNGSPKNFRCYICGHKFKVGDQFGFRVTNERGGNFMFCGECHGEDGSQLTEKRQASIDEWEQVKEKFWYFVKNECVRYENEIANERGRDRW